MTVKEYQTRLKELGFYKGAIDGKAGPLTKAAIIAFQKSVGLEADGIVGPRTLASLKPSTTKPAPATKFDVASARNLAKAHPDIQRVMNAARAEIEFKVLDSSRGKAAQEKAFKEGHSKAHFGQSAHNWDPAIAVDIFPAPYSWNNLAAFDKAAAVVMKKAKELGVSLRWGGDWNMDGNPKDGWDKPHFELHPWRTYAAKAQPYKG